MKNKYQLLTVSVALMLGLVNFIPVIVYKNKKGQTVYYNGLSSIVRSMIQSSNQETSDLFEMELFAALIN